MGLLGDYSFLEFKKGPQLIMLLISSIQGSMFQNHEFVLAIFSIFLSTPNLCKDDPKFFFNAFLGCNQSAKAQINEDLIALGQPKFVPQNVMLPHDVVSSMYKFPGVLYRIWTGSPGELEQYWSYNLDLAQELGIRPEEA